MKTAIEVLDAFENIRRAQRAGIYAPHKPLLILLALARVQRGEPRMVEFTEIDTLLKQLLAEFGPSSAAKSRHYPFWHLATDGHGALGDLSGPREVLRRPAGATPSLGDFESITSRQAFPPTSTRHCATFPACCRRWRRGCSTPTSRPHCTLTSWPQWAWTSMVSVSCAMRL